MMMMMMIQLFSAAKLLSGFAILALFV